MKKVTVVTVDTRKFVEDILKLGAVGGVIDNKCVAIKGMFLRAEVMVPEDAVVETNERVSVSADYVAKQHMLQEKMVDDSEFVVEDRPYSREELEPLSIKQVREITGVKGRDKEIMINQYLESLSKE